MPPSQQEADLPWASNQWVALNMWLDWQAALLLDDAQIKGKLQLLRRWFELSGNDASAQSIHSIIKMLETSGNTMHSLVADMCPRGSSEKAEHHHFEASPDHGNSLVGTNTSEVDLMASNPVLKNGIMFDPARSVRFRGIPLEWAEDDFESWLLKFLESVDSLEEKYLFPSRKGTGKRKALAMFKKTHIAEFFFLEFQASLAQSSIQAERLEPK